MKPLIECVPNFSEGRDASVINRITAAIKAVPSVKLLSVEMGADVNRTVVTFIGPPDEIKEAAFQAVKTAAESIDMRLHKGAHPRMGATDVLPFVPVQGISMDEVIEISKEVGRRIGTELNIPVYLYEFSASRPERKSLANIRRGEYEGLPDKLTDPQWKPDFGPAAFKPKTGATVVGAREFLIAYNITLNTTEKKYATDIAFELREKGRSARRGNIRPFYFKGALLKYRDGEYPCGNCEFTGKTIQETKIHCKEEHDYDLDLLLQMHNIDPDNPTGQSVKKPGIFKHVRAIGWFVEEYGRAQISINLTNYRETPPHLVLEETRKLAMERGLVVTGSEIVGLIPFQAMLDAGKFYLKRQGKSAGIPTRDIIETAVYSMGLNDVSPFKPEEKIIGLPQPTSTDLAELRVSEFTHEVSRESPAPGGGSIAALAGALGAALSSMVSNLTIGKEGYESVESEMMELAETAQQIKDQLLNAIDEDTNAFNAYMEARRLPKNNADEKKRRENAIQDGLKQAIRVPLNTAQLSFEALKLASTAVQKGNINSVTDAGVGAQIAFAGVIGGVLNVLINLPPVTDEDYKTDMRNQCTQLEKEAQTLLSETLRQVIERMKK